MLKKFLVLVGLVGLLSFGPYDPCPVFAEGTNTLPFQLRIGKVYVSGQDDIQTSLQVRFYTQIFHKNLGVAIGKTLGSNDKIYLMDISYQLVPDVFDFVGGVASVEKEDNSGVDLRFNFGANFNVEVFKKIGQMLLGGIPF